MNGEPFMLDTNIIIGFFKNDHSIVEKLKASEWKNIFVPGIVLGELFYGAEQSSKRTENIKRIENFIDTCQIMECNADTARVYGRVKNILKLGGTPIPENDIWIAALSEQYRTTLVTRDNHFDAIPGLLKETW